MEFNLERSIQILSATPKVLDSMLSGLSDEWLYSNEGDKTWSPHVVLGHLIHGENVNWIQRVRRILSPVDNKFEPFDREAQFTLYKDHKIGDLIRIFARLRGNSIRELSEIKLDERTLSRTGIHPEFGEVTLSQLLSTWTVHDLDHINQISRVLAKQYKDAVGPWVNYLGVLKRPI